MAKSVEARLKELLGDLVVENMRFATQIDAYQEQIQLLQEQLAAYKAKEADEPAAR